MGTNECRICYEEVVDNKSYCDCKGTMAKVHEDCLIKWFDVNKNLVNYKMIVNKECELCKTNIKMLIYRPKPHLYFLILALIFYLTIFIIILKYSGLKDDFDTRLFFLMFLILGCMFMSLIILILKKYFPSNIKIYTITH